MFRSFDDGLDNGLGCALGNRFFGRRLRRHFIELDRLARHTRRAAVCAVSRLARFTQSFAQRRELRDHVAARIRQRVAANGLHHRVQRIDSIARHREAAFVEFRWEVHRFLQPLLQRVRDLCEGIETGGSRAAGERVSGAHEVGCDLSQRIGLDFRHFPIQDFHVLLGFPDVDREESRRERDVADGDLRFFGGLLGLGGLERRLSDGQRLGRGSAEIERFERELGRSAMRRLVAGRFHRRHLGNRCFRHIRQLDDFDRSSRRFRRRLHGDRGGDFLPALDELRLAHDLGAFDARHAASLELADPDLERASRKLDEAEERRARRLLVLEPLVHHLLALPGHFAEVDEPHHAAAAF